MTQLITLRKSDILSIDECLPQAPEEDLEKALFKHAYYSKLIPKQIMGKDGVKRIHWVNPDKGKKAKKMHLVGHFHDGDHDDHHGEIAKDNEIDLNHLHRLSHGDKVKITSGPQKGKVGIFTGSHAVGKNPTARASVKFEDSDGKWKTSTPIAVTKMELVHRATNSTKAAVAPKTVQYTNAKGKKSVGSKTWVKKRKPNKKSPKDRYVEFTKEINKGVMFKRKSDGIKAFILDKQSDKLKVRLLDIPNGKQREIIVEEDRFRKMITSGAYTRVGLSQLSGDTKLKYTRMFETGELYDNGTVTFDDRGNQKISTDDAMKIVFENWDFIEQVVKTEASKYTSVDPTDVSGADMISQLVNAVTTYEPYVGSPLRSRIHKYAKDTARKRASQLHQINVLQHRSDAIDPVDSGAGTVTHVDAPAGPDDIPSSGFVSMLDVMVFHDILNDEADMVGWFSGNDDYADALMRVTGLGVGEASINQTEAAQELHGKLFNDKGEPISVDSIKKRISRTIPKLLKAYKDEADQDPTFAHTLKQAIQYRAKMRRKRDITEVGAKDLPTIQAVQDKYDGGRNAKASIAKKLIKNGCTVSYAHKLVTTVEKIVDGKVLPHDYNRVISTEYHAEIIDRTLKQMLPEGNSNKRVPDRFEVLDWYKNTGSSPAKQSTKVLKGTK